MNNNSEETANPLNAAPENNPEQNNTPNTTEEHELTGEVHELTGEVQPAKSAKKTGLIVGLIILLVALIGGGVAAAILLTSGRADDPVAMAMQKIMSGETPPNVAIDGDINILSNDPDASIKRVNIDLDSDIVVGSMINTSSAVLSFTDKNDKDYSLHIDEVYTADGDLFFKIDGAGDMIEESGLLNLMKLGGNNSTKNCINDASGRTNCETPIIATDCDDDEEDCSTGGTGASSSNQLLTNAAISIIEAADGVYLRLSSEDMKSLSKSTLGGNSTISCVTDLVSRIDKDSSSTAELYRKYPFVNSTNKDVTLSSKNNPVYRVSLDSKNFVGFMEENQNSIINQKLYSCLGMEDVPEMTESDVEKLVNAMPTIYAEVNSDNNFTRLYLESELADSATATIDLGFSYPTNVSAEEPVEYTDFSNFIQTLFTSMYNLPEDADL